MTRQLFRDAFVNSRWGQLLAIRSGGALARSWHGWLLVALLWFLLIAPAISLRSAHYEEDTVIGLARGALVDGFWLEPHLFGMRFVERPALLSWIIAALGAVWGSIPLTLARLPTVLSLLGGALLIFTFVRRQASDAAALFGVACFLVSPMILQKLVTAEPDVLLTAMSFGSFVAWWRTRGGRVNWLLRWIAIGACFTLMGFIKGPQPLAFPLLGIGAYALSRREWNELAGLALAGAIALAAVGAWYWAVYQPQDLSLWKGYSRLDAPTAVLEYAFECVKLAAGLLLQFLPGLLLVVPLAIAWFRRDLDFDRELFAALVFYALCCTLVLVFWPHARPRYAMQAVPAVAAAAALAFDALRLKRAALVNAAVTLACVFAIAQMALNWLVMPLLPWPFQRSAETGHVVSAIAQAGPQPLYALYGPVNYNFLVYVEAPVRFTTLEWIAKASRPVRAMLTEDNVALLRRQVGTANVETVAVLPNGNAVPAETRLLVVQLR